MGGEHMLWGCVLLALGLWRDNELLVSKCEVSVFATRLNNREVSATE